MLIDQNLLSIPADSVVFYHVKNVWVYLLLTREVFWTILIDID